MCSVGHTPTSVTSPENPGCAFHSTSGIKETACMVLKIKGSVSCLPQRKNMRIVGPPEKYLLLFSIYLYIKTYTYNLHLNKNAVMEKNPL